MSIVMQINPFDFFTDTHGDALDAGYVWIGQPNTDPRQYPVIAYFDAELTVPAAMPLRTANGYIVRNGSPTFLYINGNYSVMVLNKSGQQVYYVDDFLLISTGSAVSFSDLQNTTDPTKGASIIPTAERVVPSIAILRTLPKTGGSIYAFVEGYYGVGDGGGGNYWLDAADVTSVDNGGTIIVAADGGRWKLSTTDSVSVKQFGVKADAGVTDNSTTLLAARNWVAGNAVRNKLRFPSGVYGYNISPNWAIQDATIEAEGEVRLRYGGIGNAVILDADAGDAVGPIPGNIYNVKFGGANRFIVECPGTALNAVFIRAVHHSIIRAVVRGAGTTSAGLKINFAVVTEFDVIVSGNEAGVWYLGAKPAKGYSLDHRLAAETASYCYFPNPIVEGVDIGIHLVNSLGNLFVGGTSEGCTTYGVLAEANALNDRFVGTDFEANTVADVFCQGLAIEFINCDSSKLLTFGSSARRCLLTGGQHQSLDINAGAAACRMLHSTYNRFSSSGTFVDSGTNSTVLDVRNASGSPVLTGSLSIDPAPIVAGAVGTAIITVSGAQLGDGVTVSSSINLAGLILNAAVTSANTVTVYLTNIAGVTVDAPTTTLRAWILRQGF